MDAGCRIYRGTPCRGSPCRSRSRTVAALYGRPATVGADLRVRPGVAPTQGDRKGRSYADAPVPKSRVAAGLAPAGVGLRATGGDPPLHSGARPAARTGGPGIPYGFDSSNPAPAGITGG